LPFYIASLFTRKEIDKFNQITLFQGLPNGTREWSMIFGSGIQNKHPGFATLVATVSVEVAGLQKEATSRNLMLWGWGGGGVGRPRKGVKNLESRFTCKERLPPGGLCHYGGCPR
jgi:hypothetical protein